MNVEVARNLEALQPEQYVLAFVFLGSYAFALGHLFERRGRAVCSVLAGLSALAFVACCNPWEEGVMLVALALVGIGAFSSSAWLFWTLVTWRERRAATPTLEATPRPALAVVPPLRPAPLRAAPRHG